MYRGFGRRLSGSTIRIGFLGETKRTIPWSRPASGRVPRAGLVQDAACGTGAQRRLVLDETEHGAMLVHVGPAASSKTVPPLRQCGVRLQCRPIGQQRSCCDDQLNPPNIPRSSSAIAVVTQPCAPRWARSVTPTTMPCAKVSSPPSNASCSMVAGSRRRPRRQARYLRSSKAFIIRDAVTHPSDIYHRSTTNAGIRSIPTHTGLPLCSQPSRTSPLGGRKRRPSLTAAVRDSRVTARVGTEEWLRRGAEPKNHSMQEDTCRQTRHADPKLPPLHETGASPINRSLPEFRMSLSRYLSWNLPVAANGSLKELLSISGPVSSSSYTSLIGPNGRG